MLLSCKISNSVLNHIERLGGDLEALEELTDLPREFLRDPSYWVDSHRLEQLLETLELQFSHLTTECLLKSAGHATPDLRTWGVLDSVIRMLPEPQDIWAQPDRMLSYFISPPPPIGGLKRLEDGIEFDLPISCEAIPKTAKYLIGAFEALPKIAARPFFVCEWTGFHFHLGWKISQESLLSDQQSSVRQFKPELIQNVLGELEHNQRRVEELTRLIKLRDEELEAIRNKKASENIDVFAEEMKTQFKELKFNTDNRVGAALNDVFKLNDYLVRSQQIITLLIGQGRRDQQVREAMRRVDYEMVLKEFPDLIKSSVKSLQSLQAEQKQFFSQVKEYRKAKSKRDDQSLLGVKKNSSTETFTRDEKKLSPTADQQIHVQLVRTSHEAIPRLAQNEHDFVSGREMIVNTSPQKQMSLHDFNLISEDNL